MKQWVIKLDGNYLIILAIYGISEYTSNEKRIFKSNPLEWRIGLLWIRKLPQAPCGTVIPRRKLVQAVP